VKVCTRCKRSKPRDAFYANGHWADGCHPYCKECLLAYQRDRRRARLDCANPTRRRWSSSFVRHDYFASLSEPVQAYVAGLLAADGNVLERQRRVSIELAERDRELVHLVRDELAPGFPVRQRTRSNGLTTVTLGLTSEQLCTDLARIGITPRKSLTLRWPAAMPRNLLGAFLLGYFDGDGFITYSRTGRYVYPRWGLLGTKAFLSSAMDLISAETGVSRRTVRRHGDRRVYKLHISGRDAFAIDRWLHAGTPLGLERKRLGVDRAAQADSAASSSSLR
jgi:hypothetical protein